MFSSLKNGRSFCFHFGAVSMVFLPDFPGSYAIQYNRAANFTARTTKNFPKLQKKFPGVPAKISRCSMNSFGLCHEIIWPFILKSFGLSQDLPLSQNGQNLRRGKIGQWAKRIEGANGPFLNMYTLLYTGGKNHLTIFLPSWMYILPFSGRVTGRP